MAVMWNRPSKEQREAADEARRVNERIRRASLRDRIDLLRVNPDRTDEDVKQATRLAKECNRSLSKWY